jgi:hypothetical protein
VTAASPGAATPIEGAAGAAGIAAFLTRGTPVVVVVDVGVVKALDFAGCTATVEVVGAAGLASTGELTVGMAA